MNAMETRTLYERYPNDNEYIKSYIEYQGRYEKDARQSDMKLIELVSRVLASYSTTHRQVRLLDIGCSTGNLLSHLKNAFPTLHLGGGDLSELSIASCRNNSALNGIEFQVMDILRLGEYASCYNIVTANAILYGFADDLFEASLRNIGEALVSGGSLVAFDFFHPWEQDVELIEKSAHFPQGHPLHFRSYSTARAMLLAAGFEEPHFSPFRIGIDLPDKGYSSIATRTTMTKSGDRIMLRGCLSQPWCHLVARKA
jgi:SAM-dependent methyltransferase